MRKICLDPERAFDRYGQLQEIGGDDFYIHQDNGADILTVAHLDSVESKKFFTKCPVNGDQVIYCPTLDDRLGVYTICELLPRLGVKADILLTTGEEYCQSSALAFEPNHPYKWLLSFDRTGTDVVMYDYETPYLRDLVKQTGAWVGNGSYSDIADLEHLGVAGFNWGVGYEDYHGDRAHVWMSDYVSNVARFLDFYRAHKGSVFSHSLRGNGRKRGQSFYRFKYAPREHRECEACGGELREYADDDGIWYWCDECQDIFMDGDLKAAS